MNKTEKATPSAAAATLPANPKVNPKLIDSVEVILDAVLGKATMTVAELTALKADDVLTLDSALNASVELRLNGAPVARGELVAVGDKFAVRLTEIAT